MVSGNVSCWVCRILSDGDLQTVLLDGLKRQMSKACVDRSDSLTFQHKRRPGVPKYEKRCGYMAGNRSRFSKYEMAGSSIFSVNFTKSKDSS